VPTENEVFSIEEKSWISRIRLPSEKPVASIFLLHGWTGDERSMWIFTRGLSSYLVIALRGPVHAESGYGWASQRKSGGFASYSDFLQVINCLVNWITSLTQTYQVEHLPVFLMGFSQGASLALILSIRFPDRFSRIAVLSGFLPAGSEKYLKENSLSGLTYFFAYGKKDDIVPFALGRKAAAVISSAGAEVTFCDSDMGHKLDAQCFKNLYAFITG
jgi:phospholipase/carboxylesterase